MNSQKDGVKKMKLDEKSVISVEPVGSTAKSSMEEPVIRLACDLVVTGISSKVVPMSEEVKWTVDEIIALIANCMSRRQSITENKK